jgi:hypothetical protein
MLGIGTSGTVWGGVVTSSPTRRVLLPSPVVSKGKRARMYGQAVRRKAEWPFLELLFNHLISSQ